MKIVVGVEPFAEAVAATQRVVERRNTYPILANVLIQVHDDNRVTLRATDLDIEISVECDIVSGEPGTTTVPANTLNDILRKYAKKDTVEISLDEKDKSSALIRCGRSRINLAALSPDSFPSLSSSRGMTMDGEFEMSGDDLCDVFGKTQVAVSTEETRYYLNGVCLSPKEDGIEFVATDGHRMVRYRKTVPGAKNLRQIIVPSKTVREMILLAKTAGKGMVTVRTSDAKISMAFGKTFLLSKLIEGTFPDYDRVTPKNNNIVALIDVAPLTVAVDRVSTIASEKGGKAISMQFTTGGLSLEVHNPDHGTAEESMPCDYDAEDLRIGFNARYLLDCLSIIGKGTARIRLADAGQPALVTSPDNDDLMVVLMPMRV